MTTRLEDFSFHTIGKQPDLLKRLSAPDSNASFQYEDEEQLDSTGSGGSWNVEPQLQALPSSRPTLLQALSGGDPGQENDGSAMMEVDHNGPSDGNPSLQSHSQPFADTTNASNGTHGSEKLQKAMGKAAAGVVTANHSSSPTPTGHHPQLTPPLADHNPALLSSSSRVDGLNSRPDSPFNLILQYPPDFSRSVSPVKPDLARLKLEYVDPTLSSQTYRNRSPSPAPAPPPTLPAPAPEAPQRPPRQDVLSQLRSLHQGLLSSFNSLDDTNLRTSQPNAIAGGSNSDPAPTDVVTLMTHAESLFRELLEGEREAREKVEALSSVMVQVRGHVEGDGRTCEEVLGQMAGWIREYERVLESAYAPVDEDGNVEMEMDDGGDDDDEAKMVTIEERCLKRLSEQVELAQKRKADAMARIAEARKTRERERERREKEEVAAARQRRIAKLKQKLAEEQQADAEARKREEDEERQRREAEEQREEERKRQEAERKREEEERQKKEADEERKRQEEVEARKRKEAEEDAEAERQRRLVEERKIEQERAKVQEEAGRKAKKVEDERKQRETLKLRRESEAAQRPAEQNRKQEPQGKHSQDGTAEQAHSDGIHSAVRPLIIHTKTSDSTSPLINTVPSSAKCAVSSSPTFPKKRIPVPANPIAGQTLVPLTHPPTKAEKKRPQCKQQKAANQPTSESVPLGTPTTSSSTSTSPNTSLSPDTARTTSLGLRVPKPTTSPSSSRKDSRVDTDVLNDTELFRRQASVSLSASSGISDAPTIHSYDPLDQGNLPVQEYSTTTETRPNSQDVLVSGSGNATRIKKGGKQGAPHPRAAPVENSANQIPASPPSRWLSDGGGSHGQRTKGPTKVVPKPRAPSPIGSTRTPAPAAITEALISSGSVGEVPPANASAYPPVPRNVQALLGQHYVAMEFNNDPSSTPARPPPSVLAPPSTKQSVKRPRDDLFDSVTSTAPQPRRERLQRDKHINTTSMSQSQPPLQVQRRASGGSDEMFDSRPQSQLPPKPAERSTRGRKRAREDDDDGSVVRHEDKRRRPPLARDQDPRDDRGQRQRQVSDYIQPTLPSSPPRRPAQSVSPSSPMAGLQQASLEARLGPRQEEGYGQEHHNHPAVLPPSPTSYSAPRHDGDSSRDGPETFGSPPALLRRIHPPMAGPSKNANGNGKSKAGKGISKAIKKQVSRVRPRIGDPGPEAPSRKQLGRLEQRIT
ncbi:hypothetical protein PQX77_008645 [Marasmius sp. AFHP31]|nr:hypothetical protein PQX77_008645 [Marasmius sp. AFHP31]